MMHKSCSIFPFDGMVQTAAERGKKRNLGFEYFTMCKHQTQNINIYQISNKIMKSY